MPIAKIIHFYLYIYYIIALIVPLLFLPDYAHDIGISNQRGALLISIVSITSVFGRLLTGVLTDIAGLDSWMLYNVTSIVAGVATIIVPHMTKFGILAAYCVVFGCCLCK